MADTTVNLPAFKRAAEIRENSYDEATGTVEVVWSTGAKVRRYSWRDGAYYDEVLTLKPSAVRLDRLNAGAPLLDTHDSWSLDSVIGSVVPGSAAVRGGQGVAKVKLSTAPKDADRVQKIRDGIVRNVSAGYLIHRVEKSEPAEGGVAEWRVVDWEPIEISAVPVPADPGAQFRGQAILPPDIPQSLCVFETRSQTPAASAAHKENPMSVTASAETRNDATQTNNPAPAAVLAQPEPTADAARSQAAIDAAARTASEAAIRAERERAAAIRAVAAPFGLRDLADAHVDAGTAVEAFRKIAMDELARRHGSDDPQRSATGVNSHAGPADPQKRALAIENALLHRAYPQSFKLSDDGRDFRGLSLLEIARESLEAHGIRTRGLPKLEVAARALQLVSGGVDSPALRAGGMMGTTDFPVVLANVAHKTLRKAYEAAGQTFRPLVTQTTVPDFKPVTRVQLGEAPQLDRVNEHGEYKRGSMGEAGEKYAVATYGKIVGITRQVIINDDLNAFTRIPNAFGVQAAALESDLVWAEILSNPMMADGVALFHADHGNLGTGAAISVDSVGAGRLAMSKQTGLDKKTTLNIRANFIIVPEALVTKLEQFLGQIYAAKTADQVPESLRRMVPISEPRLDNGIPRAGVAGSASSWYMAAAPAQIDVVELAYLEGTEGVYTESRLGFEIDGVEVKVRMDVGAKVIDWRGLWKNPN